MKVRERSAEFILRAVFPFLMTFATGNSFANEGVIDTTDRTGKVLHDSQFSFANEVYLNGGPKNTHSPGLEDGTYYFQVTDPSGHTLLSTDPASCRQVRVVNGHMKGASPDSGSCAHADGLMDPSTGSVPVQLAPFSKTPNHGLEYRVWLIPKISANVSSDPKVLSFCSRSAKTDEFKVAAVPIIPTGSCQPSSSLSILVNGTNVISYVPKGSWFIGGSTGVSVINIEGTSITPTLIPTPDMATACASNPITGKTVCIANTASVYLFEGTSLTSTLTSSGSGQLEFSGGYCTNCGVSMDATNNRAVLGLGIEGQGGFQFLNLDTNSFEPAIVSPSGFISEGIVIDPVRNLMLSASEFGNYEIADIKNRTSPSFYENQTGSGELDSSGMDCSTGIAFAPTEGSDPSTVFIADLNQATYIPGSPSGTWIAPSQKQVLTESHLHAGATGIAIVQGTHTGVISGEFGGDGITAITLPTHSGSGIPAISDWLSCNIGNGWAHGYDPHTLAAYKSPANGNPVAVFSNAGTAMLAVVDLRKMLDPTIVPRTPGGHACASGVLPSTVVSFILVP